MRPSVRVHPRLTVLAAVLLVAAGTVFARAAEAATSLTVAQAIASQNGTSQTVVGYVVGEPVATSTVNTSGFSNDYALALADTSGETSTAKMLYVQLTSEWRASWGLKTNPALMGAQLSVTGTLTSYFSHAGLKSPTAISRTGSTPTPTPTGTSTTSPYDSTYYAGAVGKSGAALRSALHAIIRQQTVLTYDQVWAALRDTDEDPANNNNVILLYSQRSQSKTLNGGDPDDWNREHVWAKSHGDFGTVAGPGTDLHHLRPEDVSVNSARGNLDFDNGGTSVHQCSLCKADADSFEPPAAVKGDVARMVLYMAVRYEGDDGFADLEPNDSVGNGTAPYLGRLSVLKAWNAADPPSDFEKHRNEVIHDSWQGNRNPFIDHPEWVASIWP